MTTPRLPSEPSDLPAHVRLPWLAPALERAASAVCTFFAMYATLPALPGATEAFSLIGALVSAAACAAWPPIGSALAGVSLVVALANGKCHLGVVPACPGSCDVPCNVVGYLRTHRPRLHRGGSCPSMPSTHQQRGLRWQAMAWTTARGCNRCRRGAPLARSWRRSVQRILGADHHRGADSPARKSRHLGHCCGVRHLGTRRLRRGHARERCSSGIVGQVLGAAFITLFWLLACRMESSGYWFGRILDGCGLAVFLSVFLCVETVLRGPLSQDQEGEDSDELSQ